MIITRFAPSPTGNLHIGGARTALFAWLYAKSHKGQCFLRLEDTDQDRSKNEYINSIISSFNWLGIDFDGQPVYQSSRKEKHIKAANLLIHKGEAYYCDCSKQRLSEVRERQIKDGLKPRYDGNCRDASLKFKENRVVRFKNPSSGEVEYHDLIRGIIKTSNQELDDLVLLRADGSPTYNLSVVVDDADMKISHVIRGDDHINNTPRQINIFKALNLSIPEYGHVPMILGEDGKRMSKRHGATGVFDYKNLGISAEALINYFARLGWSLGDEEIFSLSELIESFKDGNINSSPSTFSISKLKWYSKEYMNKSSSQKILSELKDLDGKFNERPEYSLRVIALLKDRCSTLNDYLAESNYFFKDFESYDESSAKKFFTNDSINILSYLLKVFHDLEDWNKESIKSSLENVMAKYSVGMGKVGQPLRVAITGSSNAPSIDLVAELLGKEIVLERLKLAITKYS